jgi:hypothetical protein
VSILIAIIYPIVVEKIFYSSKTKEATSIAKIIEKQQSMYYVNNKKYIEIKKGDIQSLIKQFNLKKSDIRFYDYSIFTTPNSYTLYIEPKIKYLKQRDISPKTFILKKTLNKESVFYSK